MPNDDNKNIHENHRDRMRQRISNDGIQSLQDHEILEYLLYAYIPRKDTNPLAHKLLNLAGSLEAVFSSPREFLESIPNMTKSASLFLSSMSGIIKRCESKKDDKRSISVATVESASRYFQNLFGNDSVEQLYVALSSKNGKLAEVHKVGSGNIKECEVDMKKLILSLAGKEEKSVIVAHNHPSGNPNPSFDDFMFTKWLCSFFSAMGMTLHDHIIVSPKGYFSFWGNDVLQVYKDEYDHFCTSTSVDKLPENARKLFEADKQDWNN